MFGTVSWSDSTLQAVNSSHESMGTDTRGFVSKQVILIAVPDGRSCHASGNGRGTHSEYQKCSTAERIDGEDGREGEDEVDLSGFSMASPGMKQIFRRTNPNPKLAHKAV